MTHGNVKNAASKYIQKFAPADADTAVVICPGTAENRSTRTNMNDCEDKECQRVLCTSAKKRNHLFSDQLSQNRIQLVLLLEFGSPSLTTPFECYPGRDLSQKSSCRKDCESNSNPPNETDQNTDDCCFWFRSESQADLCGYM